MARIAGVDIPRDKRVVVSLTYIYGIGHSTSKEILKNANVNEDTRVKALTEDELNRIRTEIGNFVVEGDLRRETTLNIKRLMEIGSYRACAIVEDYQFVDKTLEIMHVLEKVNQRQLLVRRNKEE